MPRGRKKNPDASPEAKPKTKDPMERFREALSAAVEADPEGVLATLTDVLEVSTATRRRVPDKKRTVPVPKAEVPEPPKPAEPKPAVVFQSQARNAVQIVTPSAKRFDAQGNVYTIPEVSVRAENGIARVEDPKVAELMREKIAKQRARGRVPLFVELRDEVAEALAKGRKIEAIKSEKVTADTSLDELVVQPAIAEMTA